MIYRKFIVLVEDHSELLTRSKTTLQQKDIKNFLMTSCTEEFTMFTTVLEISFRKINCNTKKQLNIL